MLLQEMWADVDPGHLLWSKVGPYKLFSSDFLNLGPNKQLESEVINAYLSVLGRQIGAMVLDSMALSEVTGFHLSGVSVCKLAKLILQGKELLYPVDEARMASQNCAANVGFNAQVVLMTTESLRMAQRRMSVLHAAAVIGGSIKSV
ncbi:hypothetical protein WMY93_021976 [Mugilogobius chulae]|uniref:Uncharacterized protein n=1 Tax=Mugilogobius chulae TaxID=88201 RepID=A0AAW0NPM6_9GOBI